MKTLNNNHRSLTRRFLAMLATPSGRFVIVALAATSITVLAFASHQDRDCGWHVGPPSYECAATQI